MCPLMARIRASQSKASSETPHLAHLAADGDGSKPKVPEHERKAPRGVACAREHHRRGTRQLVEHEHQVAVLPGPHRPTKGFHAY